MVAENIKIKDIIGVAPIVEEKTVTPSTKPEKWVMPTCLVMNQTFQGDFDDEQEHNVVLIKARRGHYGDYSANVHLRYQNISDAIPRRLTRYDKVVYGAVVSLYVHHKEQSTLDDEVIYITPQMIYRTFRGDWTPRLPPSEAESIVKSLHKMMSVKIEVIPQWKKEDLTLLNKNGDRYSGLSSKGCLLNGTWVNVIFKGGYRLDCLRLNKIPILYRLGDKLNHVARQDIALMKSTRRYTPLIPQLRQYMLERIATIKGNNLCKNRYILFDTIYQNILPENPSDEQLESVRTMTRAALADFKEGKFITDYKVCRGENGKYTKIEIQLGKSKI